MNSMPTIRHDNCIALLLLLLVSYAALTWHVTTHMPADRVNCEVCTGHANPAHAVPPAMAELPELCAFTDVADYVPAIVPIVHPTPCRQRGPPASS